MADAFNAVQAGGLTFVAFGGSNDLAILGLEAEAEFTGIIDVDLELGMYGLCEAFYGLVFKVGEYGVPANTFDAFAASRIAGIHF